MEKYLNNACLKANKVKISSKLFNSTIELLENLDIEDSDNDIVQLYGYVLHAFSNKKLIADLRGSYRNTASAGTVIHNSRCSVCTCHCCDDVPF